MIKNQLPGKHLPTCFWCLCLLMPVMGTAFANADLFGLPKPPANPPIEVSPDRLETATATQRGQAALDADTCAQNINISVIGESLGGTSTSCQLLVKIFFDWAGSEDEIALSGLTLKFAFSGGEGVSIASVPVTFALQCPAYNNGTGCGGCFNFDGLNLNFCFQKGPGPDNLILRRKVNERPFFLTVLFNTAGNCLSNVSLAAADLTVADTNACTPVLTLKKPILPACPQFINGKIKTEKGVPVPMVFVKAKEVNNLCNPQHSETTDTGQYELCVCNFGTFHLLPERNDNPLNGVTVLDLALITKHILGIQYLSSPYNIIAADVNKSNAISTLDVVELRKLILGIRDTLPQNRSWYFVPKNFVFPYPQNPLNGSYPGYLEAMVSPGQPASNQDFIGIKIGDVDASIYAHHKAKRPIASLTWKLPNTAPGHVISIPISYQGTAPLEAIQLGLRFDPNQLSLLTPSPGALPSWNANCFNLSKADRGEIKAVWVFNEPGQFIEPGQTLFYLHFKVKTPIAGGRNADLLRFDDALLSNAGWQADGLEYAFEHRETAERGEAAPDPAPGLSVACLPNPGTGAPTFHLAADRARRARVHLFGAFGAALQMREVSLQNGEQTLVLSEAADLPPGVYVWKVVSEGEKAQGFWIKQ